MKFWRVCKSFVPQKLAENGLEDDDRKPFSFLEQETQDKQGQSANKQEQNNPSLQEEKGGDVNQSGQQNAEEIEKQPWQDNSENGYEDDEGMFGDERDLMQDDGEMENSGTEQGQPQEMQNGQEQSDGENQLSDGEGQGNGNEQSMNGQSQSAEEQGQGEKQQAGDGQMTNAEQGAIQHGGQEQFGGRQDGMNADGQASSTNDLQGSMNGEQKDMSDRQDGNQMEQGLEEETSEFADSKRSDSSNQNEQIQNMQVGQGWEEDNDFASEDESPLPMNEEESHLDLNNKDEDENESQEGNGLESDNAVKGNDGAESDCESGEQENSNLTSEVPQQGENGDNLNQEGSQQEAGELDGADFEAENERSKAKQTSHLEGGEEDDAGEDGEKNEESSEGVAELAQKRFGELPPFEKRERGDGFGIDFSQEANISPIIVKALIIKFLDQRFKKRESDLNVRAQGFEKSSGFQKWDAKAIAVHLKSHQLTKVLEDKFGYSYEDGTNEEIPLSFYFDLSGSMSEYATELATIAMELLKRDVKVLVGFNERVMLQVDKVAENVSLQELGETLIKTVNNGTWGGYVTLRDAKITSKVIGGRLDKFLSDAKAEKCVVFSDFDPKDEVIALSKKCQTYWFCFERGVNKNNVKGFQGWVHETHNMEDLQKGLKKVNGHRFQALCIMDREVDRG